MFKYAFSDKLKLKISKIVKKDKKIAETIYKKIKQIVNSDEESINRYKNLRYDLKDYKRAHIEKSFVLTFKVDIPKNFILFWDFDHHDNVY
ncbi:addiction module toxin RelE [Candidatus Pacearchaeota archaeon CG10_big_fil_rev_8_21_14_0_10_35_219]|nr:addiction module toxin RelE [Candidatus Pacearchaeota archaeon]OIO42214.1 MAG: hypothetical protein AUJ63_02945 [Candidatus Pacearchaeota archaeon CG1_02_35_32]PIO07317.1 MAG: addiction module toxin RelE [Candidatus Pacearchaeota archaeon CG10_big_fil_rev_8_21_14_0_10_35_219]PIY81367.1 MAG: addiction module toxin RelE [Candidatus Pacearchaeota archaeon CG_4_10_14_0_8_um_filter_35_169]PIZ79823.1 MAG: addiction module toxin RelE [Candidatus Pacearchaeota archaeon CG_4_10_14_0_2_um_filter_35_33